MVIKKVPFCSMHVPLRRAPIGNRSEAVLLRYVSIVHSFDSALPAVRLATRLDTTLFPFWLGLAYLSGRSFVRFKMRLDITLFFLGSAQFT